jgi:hypothetical protein
VRSFFGLTIGFGCIDFLPPTGFPSVGSRSPLPPVDGRDHRNKVEVLNPLLVNDGSFLVGNRYLVMHMV